MYRENGGSETNASRFLSKFLEHMNDEVHCYSSPGLASIIVHKSNAFSMLKAIKSNEDNTHEEALQSVTNRIKSELNNMPFISDSYPVLNMDNIMSTCSETLTSVLTGISPNFSNNMKAVALISSMIRTISTTKVSMLQVGLGLLCNDKKLIKHMHDYGVTCSYQEIR